MHSFIEKINKLYHIILQPIDSTYKKMYVNNYKNDLEIGNKSVLSQKYYDLNKLNKEKGVVYTPEEIALFIIKNTITPEMVINNPYIKIVDPACGCGNLIIPCFIYLKEIFQNNLELINKKNNINLQVKDINKHIIKNNLYGFDIDEEALRILMIDLFCLSDNINEKNFLNKDFLIDKTKEEFDVFIGNPPYIGHKCVDKDYSKLLKEKYKGIYKDKGDVSYCFFQKALEKVKTGGKITFITSRYFIESPSGENLRKIISDETTIYKIVDFYGIRPFKKVGIDPAILFLSKEKSCESEIEVIKPIRNIGTDKKQFYESIFCNKGNSYRSFNIFNSHLNHKGWVLIEEKERDIVKKIESKSKYMLNDICESYQGIITGCDKAFVVDNNLVEDENLEKDIIKNWIKSSSINKNKIKKSDKFIIYSDLIKDESIYPNSIKHITPYKNKLMNRRECKKGFRKWYELQWGRNQEIFEKEKIVFPYKSSSNKFALDKESYFSADVYALTLKQDSNFSYTYLLGVLNSILYEFYFKTFAKKLGENLYEYYPNNLMKLKIPLIEIDKVIDNKFLYQFFELTDEEIKIVENNLVQ